MNDTVMKLLELVDTCMDHAWNDGFARRCEILSKSVHVGHQRSVACIPDTQSR